MANALNTYRRNCRGRDAFPGLPEGWLQVLEFTCFFRGVSFCLNAGAPDAHCFAPGRSASRNASRSRAYGTTLAPAAVRPIVRADFVHGAQAGWFWPMAM